ncbi:MAG: SpoIIIAH-like family protein [Clostridia bacterium]|nr:SpoIIIAH-like family protein [Clostridia bacterium]
MNNLSKITLSDDVLASRLYDGLCESKEKDSVPRNFTETKIPKKEKKKYSFSFKKHLKKPVAKKTGKINSAILRRNTLAACCVLLIAAAVWLNFTFSDASTQNLQYMPDNSEQLETQGKILGESTFVSNENDTEQEDYFSVAVINRQRVRDEAIDMLREVVDNVETNSAIRENAFNEMTRMAEETNTEINIENLVTAKGFEDCVAVINGDTANIIVKTSGLAPEEIAQIQEIVYTQSGTLIENIKIIEKA